MNIIYCPRCDRLLEIDHEPFVACYGCDHEFEWEEALVSKDLPLAQGVDQRSGNNWTAETDGDGKAH